jgi:hypothetical protein
MSECYYWEEGQCTEPNCQFLINGKCTAKDEDLITEEEFEEMLEKETNQGD